MLLLHPILRVPDLFFSGILLQFSSENFYLGVRFGRSTAGIARLLWKSRTARFCSMIVKIRNNQGNPLSKKIDGSLCLLDNFLS